MPKPLPILDAADPCRDCGACCTYVGLPPDPGWSTMARDGGSLPGAGKYARRMFPRSAALWDAMPEELRGELTDYYRRIDAGEVEDREKSGEPCLWYDPATRRCRHYEWRPEECRKFEAGGEGCRAVRENFLEGPGR